MALWSSLSNIGSIHLANRAAPATGPLAERGSGVQIDARSQVASPPSEGRRSLVDIVARQSGAGSSHSTAQAASKRSLQKLHSSRRLRQREFGDENDYEGPVEEQQEDFKPTKTVLRRQAGSQLPVTGWRNGDVGQVFARHSDGTTVAVGEADVIYAAVGSRDHSAAAGPLSVKIVTQNGETTPVSLFRLTDVSTNSECDDGPGQCYASLDLGLNALPYSFVPYKPSQNGGLPPQPMWSINQVTGVLSGTYLGQGPIQFTQHRPKTTDPFDPNYGTDGDIDAYCPTCGDAAVPEYDPVTLYLVR